MGEDIEITVTFDLPVTVTGEHHVRFLPGGRGASIQIGREASLTSGGDGATQLVFAYTVDDRDTDTDGVAVGRSGSNFTEPFTFLSGQSIRGPLAKKSDFKQPGLDADLNYLVDGSLTGADARLSALSLSGITLDQTFAGTLTEYTAWADVASTTVTATPVQSAAGAGHRTRSTPTPARQPTRWR